MTRDQLERLLGDVAAGRLDAAAALDRLRHFPTEQLPFAQLDHHRSLRQGHPEVIFCEGKTVEQVGAIACHTGRESCFFRKLEDGRWVTTDPVLKDPSLIYKK